MRGKAQFDHEHFAVVSTKLKSAPEKARLFHCFFDKRLCIKAVYREDRRQMLVCQNHECRKDQRRCDWSFVFKNVHYCLLLLERDEFREFALILPSFATIPLGGLIGAIQGLSVKLPIKGEEPAYIEECLQYLQQYARY